MEMMLWNKLTWIIFTDVFSAVLFRLHFFFPPSATVSGGINHQCYITGYCSTSVESNISRHAFSTFWRPAMFPADRCWSGEMHHMNHLDLLDFQQPHATQTSALRRCDSENVAPPVPLNVSNKFLPSNTLSTLFLSPSLCVLCLCVCCVSVPVFEIWSSPK